MLPQPVQETGENFIWCTAVFALMFTTWKVRESTSYYTSTVWSRTMEKPPLTTKQCSLRDPLWTSDGLSYQRYLFPYAIFARQQSWHTFNTIIVAYSDTLWPEECTTSSKAVVLKYVTIEELSKMLPELLYLLETANDIDNFMAFILHLT